MTVCPFTTSVYVSHRGNTISDQYTLRSLRNVSNTLKTLVLLENPLLDVMDHRLRVLMYLPQLERLDKDPVFPEERAEALEKIKVKLINTVHT